MHANGSKIARALGVASLAGACMVALGPVKAASFDITETPLVLGSNNDPGNLFLVPSLEFPTMNYVANPGSFDKTNEYVGYFNSTNCYVYQNDSDDALDHWEPTSKASSMTCSGDDEWSGNFLNWAATQNIDPFRLALMGGYRYKDQPEETWLQKAKHDGQGQNFQYPDRTINDSSVIEDVTPFTGASSLTIAVRDMGNKSVDVSGISQLDDRGRVTSPMRFWINGSNGSNGRNGAAPYDPADSAQDVDTNAAFQAQVRVEVCNPEAEGGSIDGDLCREYDGDNYKPEGLIQEFGRPSTEKGVLRYSLISYLNDRDPLRDGGVLRAPMKYVGPEKFDVDTAAPTANDSEAQEWNENTGVLFDNPNSTLASNTGGSSVTINRSGLINYLGELGQTNTNRYKVHDPLSELYYSMTRYMRGLDAVSAYSDLSQTGVSGAQAFDDFPVATGSDRTDPLEDYACSSNAAITIADVFTHDDHNLPGNQTGTRPQEPSYWSELGSDESVVDVTELTNRVGTIDPDHGGSLASFQNSCCQGSMHIAGLAYDMNTRDQRTDPDPDSDKWKGDQTLETYAVDVVENNDLTEEERNQLYLAAKYGGFEPPSGAEFEPDTRTAALPDSWWASGDGSVSVGGGTISKRPENFYLANEPKKVQESLRKAFEQAVAEAKSTSAAVAANSTSVSTESLIFQARFNSANWSGELVALGTDANDDLDFGEVAWTTTSIGIPSVSDRDVYTIDGSSLSQIQENGSNMPSGLTFDQESAFSTSIDNDDVSGATSSDAALAEYLLLGASDDERHNGGPFRDRAETPDETATLMGDIVNSEPAVASGGNFGYRILEGDRGNEYASFLSTKKSQGDLVYVGANDGMLHAFNGAQETSDGGGEEEFAYLPDAVFDELAELSKTDYEHQFYVDGQIDVGDAYWMRTSATGTSEQWGEALVASTGRGPGKTVFALDVTRAGDPPNAVLWEASAADTASEGRLTGTQADHLGNVLGNVDIVQLGDGNFAAVFGNGYNSANHTAALFVVPLDDSLTPMMIDTDQGSSSDPNGLSGVQTVDTEGDGEVDWIYAGDLHGNMWRFEVGDETRSDWKAQLLFQAKEDGSGDSQPITAAPRVTPHSSSDAEMNVIFGTGKFFEEGDASPGSDPQMQSLYAIQDDGTVKTDNLIDPVVSGRSKLQEQIIDTQDLEATPPLRDITNKDLGGKDGWYLDLAFKGDSGNAKGERVTDPAAIVGNRVFFVTQIPDDKICGFGGDSWLLELGLESGGHSDSMIATQDDGISSGVKVIPNSSTDGSGTGSTVELVRSIANEKGATVLGDETNAPSSGPTGRLSWEELR